MADVSRETWPMVRFEEALESLPVRGKVLASAVLGEGQTPIVDQSEEFRCGFTNEDPAYQEPPYIVFGDHTRVVKFVDFPFSPGADGTKILRVNHQRFHPPFVYHYLSANPVQNLGYSRHFKLLKEIKIPCPPLAEQRRIAAILEVSARQLQKIEEELRELIKVWHVAIRLVYSDCHLHTKLEEIAEISSGITKGRRISAGQTVEAVPYLAVSNVKDGFLDLNVVKEIEVTKEERQRYRLMSGDILLTEGGDPDKLGRGTIWNGEIDEVLHQNHIFRVRIKEQSSWSPLALMAALSHESTRRYFLKSAKQTTGIASINKSQLSRTPIPVPELERRIELVNIGEQTKNQIQLLELRKALLQELHRSLSTRAFAGQL